MVTIHETYDLLFDTQFHKTKVEIEKITLHDLHRTKENKLKFYGYNLLHAAYQTNHILDFDCRL